MDEGWMEVTDPAVLAYALDLDALSQEPLYSLLTALPDTDGWWKVETEVATPPPGAGYGLQVLRTRVFCNVTSAKKFGGDMLVLAGSFLATQNVPISGGLTLLNKLRATMRLLTEDEEEVVCVIRGLAGRANPYAVAVSEAVVKAAYEDATVDIDTLLDSLEQKNIIRTLRGDKIQLIL